MKSHARHFAFNYNNCTTLELHGFLLARGVRTQDVDPRTPYKPRKKTVIQALREAESRATFRLLDIPAELRNRIYPELSELKYKHSSRSGSQEMHCWPQILRTSKKVYSEAKAVLYGPENGVKVKFEMPFDLLEAMRGHPARPSTAVNGRKTEIKRERHLDDKPLSWPTFLGKFKRLRLEITIQTPNFYITDCRMSLNQLRDALLDLHTFLCGHGNLTNLVFSLESEEMETDKRWKEILEPLRFFGGEKKFSFVGIPEEVREFVQEALE